MKRISLLAGGALALFAVTASAVDHQVIARNGPRVFDPATLQINVGDTVTFVNDAAIPAFNDPVSPPVWYSSQPMEGGLFHPSPSMSVPLA